MQASDSTSNHINYQVYANAPNLIKGRENNKSDETNTFSLQYYCITTLMLQGL